MGKGLHFLASPSCLECTVMGQRELSELVWWASYSLGTPTLCPRICVPPTMSREKLSLSSLAVCCQSSCWFGYDRS